MLKAMTIRATMIVAGMLACVSAYAVADTARQVDIAAGDLSTALLQLSKETGADLVYRPEQLRGVKTHGAHGSLTTEQAVTELLQGTKLKLTVGGTGALLIATPGSSTLSGEKGDDHPGARRESAGSSRERLQLARADQAGTPADTSTVKPSESTSSAKESPPQASVEEVVVTGSRIARPDFTALTPIVTVDATTFENRSDIGVESALEQLPQFRASGNSSNLSPSSSPFPSPTAAPGAATVDLRGLGTNRTLVLIDGRRTQPVNALLTVDLNTIPAAAIASVETITGGAAATYGADAISGVVNFKLRHDFRGLEVDAQEGISEHRDDQETSLSALMGSDLADNKGNLMLALNYSKRGQIWSEKRAWVRAGWNDPGTPIGARGDTANSLLASPLSEYVIDSTNAPTGAGAFVPLRDGGYWIDQSGNLFDRLNPLNPAHTYTGPLGGTSGYKINPGGTLGYTNEAASTLGVPLTRWTALLTGHYDFNDHVSAFVEAAFTNSQTQAVGSYAPLSSIYSVTVPYNPLYDDPSSPTFEKGPVGTSYHPVPAQLAAILNSRPNPNAPWEYNGGTDYLGPYTTDTTSDIFQLTTGLRGDVPGTDWTWEVYGSHGRSSVSTQLNGFPTLNRLQALFDANQYGAGWTNPFPIAVGGACTSGLPIFNPDGSVNNSPTVSADCATYADPSFNNRTTLTQSIYEGDIQGALFDMPFFNAGKLRYALGADYRGEDFNFSPDSGYSAYQAYPEVVDNISLPVAVEGHTGVSELYTEFSIPVVKDLSFAKSIEIDPGFRFSHYDASEPGQSAGGGNVNTWKLLGNWSIAKWVTFRGGLEVANRAPNVAELFTPIGGSSIASGGDPCAAYEGVTPGWGNVSSNPNRYNVQALCQYLITRDGGPASIMVPGGSANNYQYNVFGYSPTAYLYQLAVTQGNPNLKSERARTVTGGVVFSSPFSSPLVQRMRMSVDWYQIQIDGAIGIPAVGTVYRECLDPQYNNLVAAAAGQYTGAQMAANNAYCALIEREYAPAAGDPYGAPRKYKAEYINQGGIQSRGIDLELDWGLRFADVDLLKAIPGGINVNILGSYLDRYALSPFPGAAYINYTGTTVNSSFRYKLFSTFGYSVGPASIGFRWQHLPGVSPDPTTASSGTLGVASHNQVDLFARWTINDTFELRGGIDNLLDAWPEWVGANPQNKAVGTTTEDYDTIGRRFYLGVKAKF